MFTKVLKTAMFYVLGGPVIGGLFLCFCLLYGVAWITKGYHISDKLCDQMNELFEEALLDLFFCRVIYAFYNGKILYSWRR